MTGTEEQPQGTAAAGSGPSQAAAGKAPAGKSLGTGGTLAALKARGFKLPKLPKTPEEKKKAEKRLYMAIGGVFVLFIILSLFSCGPRKGTLLYGVCKVFAETQLQFPTTMKVRFVEQYPMAVRIGYNYVDGFGQYVYKTVECAYRPDPNTGLAMDSVLVNRKELPKKIVDDFNIGLAGIVKNPPDLTLPPPMPAYLNDLKEGE